MENDRPATTSQGRRRGGKPGKIHLALSYPALIGLTLLLIAPTVLVVVFYASHKPTVSAGGPIAAKTDAVLAPESIHGKPGPWGELVYLPIHISPPMELIEASNGYLPETRWYFPNNLQAQVQALFMEKDITDAQREAILKSVQPAPDIDGFVAVPPQDVVYGLSPEARARIYKSLARSPLNRSQANAFRFCGETVDEWLDGSDVRPETRDRVRTLTYRNGRFMLFADLPAVIPALKGQEEKLGLIKALSHEATFLIRLQVDDKSDVDALVTYWGRGGRAKDVRPILESVAELHGSRAIAVPYLLPPFVRQRIYTYPEVSEEPNASHRDCHWTALNFFSEQPDDRLTNREYAAKVIESDYYRIYSGFQLGDLIVFMTGPSNIIHSCVYIADDVVFTKNGSRPSNPWMFMRLEDMKDFYPTETPLTVSFLRHKGI